MLDAPRHIAYCTGPAQLVYLLSALETEGVSPRDVCIVSNSEYKPNERLQPALSNVVDALCFRQQTILATEADTLTRCFLWRHVPRWRPRTFWYCRGAPHPHSVMSLLKALRPSRVFEYYDGFRATVTVRLAATRRMVQPRLSWLSTAERRQKRERFMTWKALEADRYFMPRHSQWEQYAAANVLARTTYLRKDVIWHNVERVGRLLQKSSPETGASSPGRGPGFVLLAGLFSQRCPNVQLEDEVRLYGDILKHVRAKAHSMPLLVKMHPRTTHEKRERLADLCDQSGARLSTDQQLVEFVIQQAQWSAALVVGGPSTALLNVRIHELGLPLCASGEFMSTYLGEGYATSGGIIREDHRLMENAGVASLSHLDDLTVALERVAEPVAKRVAECEP